MKFMFLVVLAFGIDRFCFSDYYRLLDRSHGMTKAKIVLETKQDSTISCVYRCNLEDATSIYENGNCKCLKENTLENKEIGHSRIWKKESKVCFPKESNSNQKCVYEWTLIASKVCYQGLGSGYGSFTVNKNGMISSLKLQHISGLITCDANDPRFGSSIWSCGILKDQLTTFVTNDKNHIIFPPGVRLKGIVSRITYSNRSLFEIGEKFLWYYGPTIKILRGTELRIWNGNDLASDRSDLNNAGVHCVNVYAQFADHV